MWDNRGISERVIGTMHEHKGRKTHILSSPSGGGRHQSCLCVMMAPPIIWVHGLWLPLSNTVLWCDGTSVT